MYNDSDKIIYSVPEFTYKHSISTSVDDKIYTTHIHSGVEIIYLIEGSITYGFEGKEICAKSGDILITPPFVYHYLKFNDKKKYERINILIYPETYGQKIAFDEVKILNDKSNIIYSILKMFDYYYKFSKGDETNQIFNLKIQEMIFVLQKCISKTQSISVGNTENTFNLVLQYINRNIYKPITIKEIGNACFISEGHVHHLFHDQLKTSPKNYILMKKLSLAQNMLLLGTSPTKVCFNLGFEDYSVFYRNYLKKFGKKPTDDYKKK